MDYRTADQEKTQAPINLGELKRARDYDTAAGQCSRPMSSEEIVAEFFKYHAPNELTIPKYAAINQAAKNFAEIVLANCPSGAYRSAAIPPDPGRTHDGQRRDRAEWVVAVLT